MRITSSMHFGGCFGEFIDKATIVWYVKANSTQALAHSGQTPEVAHLCVIHAY